MCQSVDEEWRTQRLSSSSESGHPKVCSSHTVAGPQLGHVCIQGETDIIILMGESELTCDLNSERMQMWRSLTPA